MTTTDNFQLSTKERNFLKVLILAIESSAKPVSVAVYDDEKGMLLGQYFQNNGFSHSRTLLVLVESLLKNLDIKLADIGLIAVAYGPGSFTGVRIGVSAVKGMAWGADIPVCGVSTLEAMAHQVFASQNNHVLICPVMDARRNQVYNALFKQCNGSLQRLCEDRAISIEDLAEELKKHDTPCLLVGDGITVCIESGLIPKIMTPQELIKYQTAYGVALAALNKKPGSAIDLEPVYLRPSQAEREKAEN